MLFRLIQLMALTTVILRAQACPPITTLDISRIQAYVAAHYHIPGGVTVLTDAITYFPQRACLLRVPVKAAQASIQFHDVLFLSADKRYLAKDLMDLSADPEEAEQTLRNETIAELNSGNIPRRGADHGAVNVLVFSDLQCPYCADLNLILTQQILPRFGSAVTIRFRHLPLPSHRWSRDAALIAACLAEQNNAAFWTFNDVVFDQRRQIFSDQAPVAKMEHIAKRIPGLSWETFENCRRTDRPDQALARDQKVALWYDVAAAPTIFVGDIRIDGLPTAEALVATVQTATAKSEIGR